MNNLQGIHAFLEQPVIAIAGVSRDKKKFGNHMYTTLKQRGKKLVPINPHLDEFDGDICYSSVQSLPDNVTGLVICTSPTVSKDLVSEAMDHGIRHVWLQQGAENTTWLDEFKSDKLNLISGKCILMYAEPVSSYHAFHRLISKLFGKY